MRKGGRTNGETFLYEDSYILPSIPARELFSLKSVNSPVPPSKCWTNVPLPSRRGWRAYRGDAESSRRGEARRRWVGTEKDDPFEARREGGTFVGARDGEGSGFGLRDEGSTRSLGRVGKEVVVVAAAADADAGSAVVAAAVVDAFGREGGSGDGGTRTRDEGGKGC